MCVSPRTGRRPAQTSAASPALRLRLAPVRQIDGQREGADAEREVERGRRIVAALELPGVIVIGANEQQQVQHRDADREAPEILARRGSSSRLPPAAAARWRSGRSACSSRRRFPRTWRLPNPGSRRQAPACNAGSCRTSRRSRAPTKVDSRWRGRRVRSTRSCIKPSIALSAAPAAKAIASQVNCPFPARGTWRSACRCPCAPARWIRPGSRLSAARPVAPGPAPRRTPKRR